MRTRFRALLLLPLLAACVVPAQAQSWVLGPSMPTPRHEAAVAVLGGELYVIGGRNVTGASLGRVERFHPAENAWEGVESLRNERHAAAAVAYNGRIVLMGGREGSSATDDVEEYVPNEDDWESFDSLERGRAGLSAVVLGGRIYALGGTGSSGSLLASTEVYDGNDWGLHGPWVLDPTRAHFGTAEAGGAAYLAGGLSQFGPLDLVERYAVGESATVLAPLPSPRGNLALASTGDALFAIGGVDSNGNVLDTVTRYDIGQNAWTPVAPLNTAREGAVAAVLDGTLYVAGGRDAVGNVLNTVEMYLIAVDDEDAAAPTTFGLDAAFPNPFAHETTLTLRLAASGSVRLAVYDVQGRQVAALADGVLAAGEHRVSWDGTADGRLLPAGVYVARLTGSGGHAVTKLTLLR